MDAKRPSVGLCIPTLNPGRWIDRLVPALANQTRRPDVVLVIDSSSTDGTVEQFESIGADILRIARDRFDHGETRTEGAHRLGTDVVVFLTQDAIPADEHAIDALVTSLLESDDAGVAFGRQLAGVGASSLARAHREFNYGSRPYRRTAADVPLLGVRAAFCSNSFAAYRRAALDDISGFPYPVIGSEDRWAAARLLSRGWSVIYVPAARVEHWHDHTLRDQFRRYFDIGVFHADEPWFDQYLGHPDGEGLRLVRAQLAATRRAKERLGAPKVFAHAGAAWLGFQAGRRHRRVPPRLVRQWSSAPAYFRRVAPGRTASHR